MGKIRLTIPKGKDYISVLRLTASSVANCYKFSIDEIEDIKICVAEAAILYINSHVEDDMTIFFEFKENALEIEIVNYRDYKEESLSAQIITALMDDIKSVDGSLFMRKYLKGNNDD